MLLNFEIQIWVQRCGQRQLLCLPIALLYSGLWLYNVSNGHNGLVCVLIMLWRRCPSNGEERDRETIQSIFPFTHTYSDSAIFLAKYHLQKLNRTSNLHLRRKVQWFAAQVMQVHQRHTSSISKAWHRYQPHLLPVFTLYHLCTKSWLTSSKEHMGS